jgi:hypothetical protein
MTSTSSEAPQFIVDTRMIKVGATIASAGLLLATAGMGLASAAVARVARDWMRQRDISPSAAAAAKLHQARRASVAGAHAWRSYSHADSNGAAVRSR